ncbi:serine hydrolase domain-containing protein [Goodfellowiella coeruleoviolacea]|uniref:serine hydrolase domain-containing protein n=1 Tax=Goodfellowiella coeruleoviolacea TaxID=334858 RepID=UPI0020A359E8|nr:serine hydrolase domain-containing protein [Goodfellowiella coeruleoviolacea]
MRKSLILPVAVAAGLLSLSTPVAASAAAPDTTPPPMSAVRPSGLDPELLNRMLDEVAAAGAPAVLAEARVGEQTWSGARGARSPGSPVQTRPTDRVRVASLTKSMVATVLLQLVREGRVGLDDPIARHLPGLLPYPETITVRQLLGHTSGISEYILDDLYPSVNAGSAEDVRTNRYRAYTPRQLVAMATSRPLLFAPGTGFSYSNANYVIIGLLIEKLTGHSAESEVTNRVLRPVGMHDSYMPHSLPFILGPHPSGNYATGDPNDPLVDSTDLSPTQFFTAGAVISTPHDINNFYRAMFDGTLLSPELLAEARHFNDVWQGMYGLGVLGLPLPDDCAAVPGHVVYGHTGGGLGYTTYSFSSPDASRQITFTYTLDSTLDPKTAAKLGAAANRLGVAALCSTDPAA